MNIDLCIKELFPAAEPMKDYKVQQNEEGVQSIAYWNEDLGPQPTNEELLIAWNTAQTKVKEKSTQEEVAELKTLNANLLMDSAKKSTEITELKSTNASILMKLAINGIQ